jgi:hypothetical protein
VITVACNAVTIRIWLWSANQENIPIDAPLEASESWKDAVNQPAGMSSWISRSFDQISSNPDHFYP